MGLPKIMPPTAVGSVQTGLRKGFPSPVFLLCRVLPGGRDHGPSDRLHHATRAGESGFPEPVAAQNPRTDPAATGHTRPAVEHRRESPARGGHGHDIATAAGNLAPFRPVSAALLALLRGYKLLISPLLPSACRFYPTCSCYMHDAVGTHGAVRGIYLGIRRLLKCHPWHPGGIDRVPLPPKPQRTELHGR